MGRPKKYDTDEVLNSAMTVFWTKGYHATSYEDLMISTGLNKQSLYHSFGDKKSLFIKTLEFSISRSLINVAIIFNKSKSPLKAVMDLCYSITKTDLSIAPQSCFVVRSTMEFGEVDEDILKRIDKCYEDHEELFANAISKAQSLGEVTTSLSSKDIAKSLLNTWNGIRVQQQRGGSERELKKIFETSFKLFKANN